MNKEIERKARELADERLIALLLPTGSTEEKKDRFLTMLREGKLAERRLEITLSGGRKKTMAVKEVTELLYKEEYAKLMDNVKG